MKTSKKLRPTLDIGSHINARYELLPEAGARHERTLLGVGSKPWLGQPKCAAVVLPTSLIALRPPTHRRLPATLHG
jgi:hypothetical protein